jgi:hypothetical protein
VPINKDKIKPLKQSSTEQRGTLLHSRVGFFSCSVLMYCTYLFIYSYPNSRGNPEM